MTPDNVRSILAAAIVVAASAPKKKRRQSHQVLFNIPVSVIVLLEKAIIDAGLETTLEAERDRLRK
ncbi:hypothetical protein [Ferrovibrio terrae]|uniref:hypothetical protein n=1 Tax=Ferrovibrio terrae TaxID=2594003 RepID=UPI003137AEA4